MNVANNIHRAREIRAHFSSRGIRVNARKTAAVPIMVDEVTEST